MSKLFIAMIVGALLMLALDAAHPTPASKPVSSLFAARHIGE